MTISVGCSVTNSNKVTTRIGQKEYLFEFIKFQNMFLPFETLYQTTMYLCVDFLENSNKCSIQGQSLWKLCFGIKKRERKDKFYDLWDYNKRRRVLWDTRKNTMIENQKKIKSTVLPSTFLQRFMEFQR